jgi:hypothetical protein
MLENMEEKLVIKASNKNQVDGRSSLEAIQEEDEVEMDTGDKVTKLK